MMIPAAMNSEKIVPMLLLTLIRCELTQNSTGGMLYLGSKWQCDTLEPPVREGPKVKGSTAIPDGRYLIEYGVSKRFKRPMPYLMNVPNFNGIMIHTGNTVKDTAGCILVGLRSAVGKLFQSRKEFDALNKMLQSAQQEGKRLYIEIKTPEGGIVDLPF